MPDSGVSLCGGAWRIAGGSPTVVFGRSGRRRIALLWTVEGDSHPMAGEIRVSERGLSDGEVSR